LRATDGDVRAEFPRRLDKRQREQIGGNCQHGSGGMGFLGKPGVIMDGT